MLLLLLIDVLFVSVCMVLFVVSVAAVVVFVSCVFVCMVLIVVYVATVVH